MYGPLPGAPLVLSTLAPTVEFRRNRRYVEYFLREGVTDSEELFAFLADLRTN